MNFNLYNQECRRTILSEQEIYELRSNNFQHVTNILNDHNICNWPQGKTMLGLCRDGCFIPDDHDEDIGIMCDNYEIVHNVVVPNLVQNGFTVIRVNKNKAMITVMRGPRYIDLCFFSIKENTIGYENKWFPIDFYTNFIQKTINNFTYIIPTKYQQICQYSYHIIIPTICNMITPINILDENIFKFIYEHQDRHFMYNILYPLLNNFAHNNNVLNIGYEWHNALDIIFFPNVTYYQLDKIQRINDENFILQDMTKQVINDLKFKVIIDYGVIGWNVINISMNNSDIEQYIQNVHNMLLDDGLYCIKLDMKDNSKHKIILQTIMEKFTQIFFHGIEEFDIYKDKIIKYKTLIFQKI